MSILEVFVVWMLKAHHSCAVAQMQCAVAVLSDREFLVTSSVIKQRLFYWGYLISFPWKWNCSSEWNSNSIFLCHNCYWKLELTGAFSAKASVSLHYKYNSYKYIGVTELRLIKYSPWNRVMIMPIDIKYMSKFSSSITSKHMAYHQEWHS